MDLISDNNPERHTQTCGIPARFAPGQPRCVCFQIVGCDHQLGSAAKEDNCGVCGGDGATCRLVRGHYRTQLDSGRSKNRRRVLGQPGPLCLTVVSVCSVKARTRWSSFPTGAATCAWF